MILASDEQDRLEQLNKMWNTKEALHPDLVPFIKKGNLFPMIHHPLVVYAPYNENMNYMANRQYEAKTEAVKKAMNDKNWHHYIWLHERPYRLEAFIMIMDVLHETPELYWELLHDIWIDCEAPHVNKQYWKQLFEKNLPSREKLMDADDRIMFINLPKVVTVYRGYDNPKHVGGISHTLELSVAEKFSRRFGKVGGIAKAEVPKEKIIAYTNGRSEHEVIITNRIKYTIL
jgi:hypothetical protein